ncbi:hypothetical protein DENSPDRAFT_832725 [Dentipellis sp. KUC8613]|nr:hypothetical protein DENSPDRAFT_832725 [Dentipellis sp. KUC8613]
MPLQSRPRLSDEERYQENLMALQNRQLLENPPNGSSKPRVLSAWTLARNAEARKLWEDYIPFADPAIPGPPLTAEIVPGTPVPHAGEDLFSGSSANKLTASSPHQRIHRPSCLDVRRHSCYWQASLWLVCSRLHLYLLFSMGTTYAHRNP